MSTRPDILLLVIELKSTKMDGEIIMSDSPPHDGKVIFNPSWFPAALQELEQLQTLPGFGPHVVQKTLSDIYYDKTEQETLNLEVWLICIVSSFGHPSLNRLVIHSI